MSFFRPKWTSKGEEIPDPTPLAVAVDIKPQKSIHEKVIDVLRSERWNQMMRAQGLETFEEANDFDIGDDDDAPPTPYEAAEDGNFYAARRGEIAGNMVEDIEMSEKQRDILRRVDDHIKNPKKEVSDNVQPVPKV